MKIIGQLYGCMLYGIGLIFMGSFFGLEVICVMVMINLIYASINIRMVNLNHMNVELSLRTSTLSSLYEKCKISCRSAGKL